MHTAQVQPGVHFKTFLDSVSVGRPLKIIETGCLRDLGTTSEFSDGWSTLWIARWAKEHEGTEFHSVDLSIAAIELAHMALEAEDLAAYCQFHCQDSLKYLASQTWVDFCFLDSCDGLQHGLDEFRLAASAGSQLVVMDDYATKAAWAVREAKQLNWEYCCIDRYSVLRRPK
jgi:predicted O-methyltransferase YrrM